MADMKKVEMAEAAERLLAGTTWLPALLRTPPSDQERRRASGERRSNTYPQAVE
jgi:ParB family chromosome partitioning protein